MLPPGGAETGSTPQVACLGSGPAFSGARLAAAPSSLLQTETAVSSACCGRAA